MSEKMLFLQIMDRFLHGEKTGEALAELSAEETGRLLNLGRVHSLYPVVFEAVRLSEGYLALPEEMRAACKKEARSRVIGQAMRTSLFLGLYQRILAAGVTPLVMKGLVLRDLYAQPDSRSSGDEDLLVKREEFPALDACLVAQGFKRELPDKPLEAHEITYWHRNGLHIEVHLSLFPEDSEAYGHLNRAFEGVFARQVTEEILGVGIHTLEPTDHMLYLLCHGVKHFLHTGFGIRQVCDMVIFAESYGSRIDWKVLERKAKEEGIWVFAMNLFFLGEKYLGFSWEKAGLRKPDMALDCEAMLADLLDSGIYGHSSAERTHSANITLQAVSAPKNKAGLGRTLFPARDYMETRYGYVKRHGWLLPVAWGQRIVGYLRRTDRKEAAQTVQTGQRRVALLKQYGLLREEGQGRDR